MKEFFKHPIPSGVIATLIAAFIAWMLGFAPAIWGWLKQIAGIVWSGFTYELHIPLWMLALISIPLIVWLVRIAYAGISKSSGDSDDNNFDSMLRKTVVGLTADENSVMQLFIQADGRLLDASYLKYSLGFPALKIEQIIEALEEKQLIEIYNNPFNGTKFSLTRSGRDFMIGNTYSS